jgi:hypothetical protein
MKIPTNPKAATGSAPPAALTSDAAAAVKTADSIASQRIQTLGLVRQARLAQLTRTAASVSTNFGATSAQATAAQAAITSSKTAIARLATVKDQVSTAAPKVAANGWALYGHVYNAQLQPVTAYTVFLVNAQNTYQQTFGFAYTDDTGYFLISYAPAKKRREDQAEKRDETQDETFPQLFLEIVNTKAQPVYLSTAPFQPTLGSATYQNVTLPAGEAPIGDPPTAIRNIGIPKTGA